MMLQNNAGPVKLAVGCRFSIDCDDSEGLKLVGRCRSSRPSTCSAAGPNVDLISVIVNLSSVATATVPSPDTYHSGEEP